MIIYSKTISLTSTEILRKNFQNEERQILNYLADKNENPQIRLATIWALKANRLRGITIIDLFIGLEDILFDLDEDVDIRSVYLL